MLCRAQVDELRPRSQDFSARGASLALIGNGNPAQAAAFQAELAGDVPVFTDPSRRLYRLAGFGHGVAKVLDPRAALAGVRTLAAGYRQPLEAQGDPLQLGGALVVTTTGQVRYGYTSRFAGDHPPIAALLAALA